MPGKGKINFDRIARAALDAADRLVPTWLPDGIRNGVEWVARNPMRSDNRPGSFSVNLTTGRWGDFAADVSGGDLISLYAYLFEGDDNGKAARALADALRLDPGPTAGDANKKPAAKKRGAWTPIVPVPEDAPPPPRAHQFRGKHVAEWAYCDASGHVIGYVRRFVTSDGGKDLIPLVFACHDGSGKRDWRWQQWAEPRPLYGLHWLGDGEQPVLIVEGEKCAEAAHAQLSSSYDVITWPGGGKAVTKVDWSPLAGRKVVIWPDADAQRHKDTNELLPLEEQPGVKAAEKIASLLAEEGCAVRIVNLPVPGELAGGWDIADAVAEGWSEERLLAFVRNQRAPSEQQPKTAPKRKAKATKPPKREFVDGLLRSRGEIAPVMPNVVAILQKNTCWQGVIAQDLFASRVVKRKPLPGVKGDEPGEWADVDTSRVIMWLAEHYQISPSGHIVDEAVNLVAAENAWHPVRDYLESLQWDGKQRIDTWLIDYLGVSDSEYSRKVSRWFLIAMCARVFKPGCKFDTCLVLEGTQGLRKSTALRVLAGEWFSDTELDLANKDSMSAIRGKWLQEFAEMGSIARTESMRQKSFLSRQVDEFRPAFGRREIRCPRQIVFAGTTNDWQWQKDPTGGRRFWPVEVSRVVDDAGLAEVRAQLFAEAVSLYHDGERYWPTPDEQRELFDPEQLKRESEDAFFDAIHDWLENTTDPEFTMHDVLRSALKLDAGRMTRDVMTRVGMVLKKLGCGRVERRNGVSRHVYTLPDWTEYAIEQKHLAEADSRDGSVPL